MKEIKIMVLEMWGEEMSHLHLEAFLSLVQETSYLQCLGPVKWILSLDSWEHVY